MVYRHPSGPRQSAVVLLLVFFLVGVLGVEYKPFETHLFTDNGGWKTCASYNPKAKSHEYGKIQKLNRQQCEDKCKAGKNGEPDCTAFALNIGKKGQFTETKRYPCILFSQCEQMTDSAGGSKRPPRFLTFIREIKFSGTYHFIQAHNVEDLTNEYCATDKNYKWTCKSTEEHAEAFEIKRTDSTGNEYIILDSSSNICTATDEKPQLFCKKNFKYDDHKNDLPDSAKFAIDVEEGQNIHYNLKTIGNGGFCQANPTTANVHCHFGFRSTCSTERQNFLFKIVPVESDTAESAERAASQSTDASKKAQQSAQQTASVQKAGTEAKTQNNAETKDKASNAELASMASEGSSQFNVAAFFLTFAAAYLLGYQHGKSTNKRQFLLDHYDDEF